MTRFLAVSFRKVIDTKAVPAVPEIPAVMTADNPPVEMVPAVPGIPAVTEVSHEEVDTMWIDDNADRVASNMATGNQRNRLDVDYYELSASPGSAMLKKVTLRTGARVAAPARETVEIEAGGLLVGSAEVDA